MVRTGNPVYYSTCGDFMPDQVKSLSQKAGVDFYVVSVDRIFEPAFRDQLILSSALWVIGYGCLEKLIEKENIAQLGHLPEMLVLVNEEVNEEVFLTLNSMQLPESVSFILFPTPEHLFFLQLYQGLKKARERKTYLLDRDRHEGLFVNSSQAKLIIDPATGDILDANTAACKLYDRDPDDLLMANLGDIHPESFKVVCSNVSSAIKGDNATVNIKFLKKDGDIRELQYIIHIILLGGKKVVSLAINDVTESGKAYEMFFQKTEMLRNTLESIDDTVFSLNVDGDFIEYYQPSGSSHLSLSSDVFVGKNIYDVGFPLDVARKYIQTIEQVIEEDKAEQIEYFMEAFGTRLWYNAKISPRKNEFGMVDGVTVICRDVTKQKKTEENLKKARDFYLTLLSDFPSMIWKTNATKRADYFNKTWLEFTGNDMETELKTDWVEKIYIADVSNFLSVLLNAYLNKESFQIEHRLKHHSGEYRWVINAGRPFYNIDGQFAGFIGSCYDICERRNAEEMLHLQKSAMESALEGIMIIEDDNNNYPVIYSNKEISRLTDTKAGDIIGKGFLEILGCPANQPITNELVKALKSRESFKGEFYLDHLSSEENLLWRLLYLAPVKDKKEAARHFVAVLSDITETKEVEKTLREKNKQLRKTNEELDSFVYSTSHELRSPLMSVLGLLNLLETDIDTEDRKSYLSMIRESISRLDKIIHDIIDYSRNSRIEVMYERIDFNSTIEKLIANHKYMDNFDKIRFSIHVQDGVAFLSDKKRIQILLNNFISNSLRFHNFDQHDPYIKITVKTSPVNVLISVTDNGTGIHEKHLPKIYDMFYRGTEKSKGSGIGLYIVKEIVDKLKGSIQLESEPNVGSTFTVDLPNYLNKNYKGLSMAAPETNIS